MRESLASVCIVFFGVVVIALSPSEKLHAKPPQAKCVYRTEYGSEFTARSMTEVPIRYRGSAQCGAEGGFGGSLAAPSEIELGGNIRRDSITTNLGRMDLRWPRTLEAMFGKNPFRAVASAARVVSRALGQPGFEPAARNMNLAWQVVLMDETLPEAQVPSYLISNCHPGWMTPPANIYIVGQRVAAGCSGNRPVQSSNADTEMEQVLVHEMGHAVEAFLLSMNRGTQPAGGALDRLRAEGFATWFEQFASQFSAAISSKNPREYFRAMAIKSISASPNGFTFQGTGSAEDYSRASMYFNVIVDKKGLAGLMKVYETIRTKNLDFFSAIEATHGWDRAKMDQEVIAYVRR